MPLKTTEWDHENHTAWWEDLKKCNTKIENCNDINLDDYPALNSRVLFRRMVRRYKEKDQYDKYKSKLEEIWEEGREEALGKPAHSNFVALALALIDSPEEYRLKFIKPFTSRNWIWNERLLRRVTSIQIGAGDPASLFACVATKEYMEFMHEGVRKCNWCEKRFRDWEDVIWKGCGEHTFHRRCVSEIVTDLGYSPDSLECKCLPHNRGA